VNVTFIECSDFVHCSFRSYHCNTTLGLWRSRYAHFFPRHYMVVSDQFHFELLLSLGNKSPFSILHGKWNVTHNTWWWRRYFKWPCREFLVKSPESLNAVSKKVLLHNWW